MGGRGETQPKIDITDIPAAPDVIQAHLPLVDAKGAEMMQVGLGTLGSQVAESSDPGELMPSGLLENWPAAARSAPGSLVDYGSMWKVQDLTSSDDTVEVSLGRRGGGETSFRLPRKRAAGLEVGELVAAPSEALFEEKRFLGTVRVRVEFRPDSDSPPVDIDIFLPLLRLHCPRHAGCEAEYAIGTATGTSQSIELSIFGAGGGAGKAVECTLTQTYTTKGRCIEIGVPGKLRMQMGRTFVNGTEVAYGMRASVVEVQKKELAERTLPAGHGCEQPYDEVREAALWTLDRRNSEGGQDELQRYERALKQESQGKLSLGLDLGQAPLKLGLEYMRKVSADIAIKTGVSPGARYAAYEPQANPGFELLWTDRP
jgi:hypothetical protein